MKQNYLFVSSTYQVLLNNVKIGIIQVLLYKFRTIQVLVSSQQSKLTWETISNLITLRIFNKRKKNLNHPPMPFVMLTSNLVGWYISYHNDRLSGNIILGKVLNGACQWFRSLNVTQKNKLSPHNNGTAMRKTKLYIHFKLHRTTYGNSLSIST